jgi:hypothetical protein
VHREYAKRQEDVNRTIGKAEVQDAAVERDDRREQAVHLQSGRRVIENKHSTDIRA